MESSEAVLSSCSISEGGEEGVVVMDNGRALLHGSTCVRGCGGPGVDVSGSGRVAVGSGCGVEGSEGRLWLWEEAQVEWPVMAPSGGAACS
jgi:hypothetical protein